MYTVTQEDQDRANSINMLYVRQPPGWAAAIQDELAAHRLTARAAAITECIEALRAESLRLQDAALGKPDLLIGLGCASQACDNMADQLKRKTIT